MLGFSTQNVRHRSVLSRRRSDPWGHRAIGRGSRRRVVNRDNLGLVAIISFILVGIVLFLFFGFHHHEYDIDNGTEAGAQELPEGLARRDRPAASPNTPGGDGAAAVVSGVEISSRDRRDAAGPISGRSERGGSLRGGTDGRLKGSRRPRVVTIVLPSVVNPDGRKERLEAIAETWGPSARAVYVVHNTSEFPFDDAVGGDGAVLIDADTNDYDPAGALAESPEKDFPDAAVFPRPLVIPPTITEDDGVSRLQYVIRSVHHTLDPDFAFFVNDHTFVIPEHICTFLYNHDPARDLYAGHAMKNQKEGYMFNTGAAGYLLSRHTMQELVHKWDEGDPKCLAEHAAKWLQGNPGLVTAKCLRESMHINAIDTRDDGGRHMFHAYGLVRTITGNVDEWYKDKHKKLDTMLGPDRHGHQHMPLKGVDCCSPNTVSFHYGESKETRALYEVRGLLKSNAIITDEDLKEKMISLWPQGKDLGRFSHGLPQDSETDDWDNLIAVLRRISNQGESDTISSPPC